VRETSQPLLANLFVAMQPNMEGIHDAAAWLQLELVAMWHYVYGVFLFLIGLIVDNATKSKQTTNSIPSLDHHHSPACDPIDPEANCLPSPFAPASDSESLSSTTSSSESPANPVNQNLSLEPNKATGHMEEEESGCNFELDLDAASSSSDNYSSSAPSGASSPEIHFSPRTALELLASSPRLHSSCSLDEKDEVIPSSPPLSAESQFQVVGNSRSRRGSKSKEPLPPGDNQSTKSSKRQKKNKSSSNATDQQQQQQQPKEKKEKREKKQKNKDTTEEKEEKKKKSKRPDKREREAKKKADSKNKHPVPQTPHQPNDDYYRHSALRLHSRQQHSPAVITSSSSVPSDEHLISPIRQPVGPPANSKDRGFSAEYKKARSSHQHHRAPVVLATVSL